MVQNGLIIGHRFIQDPISSGVSERAHKRVNAAERAIEASVEEQVNE